MKTPLLSIEVIDSTKSIAESPSVVIISSIISSEDACDSESPIVISSEENEEQRDPELVEARSFEILDPNPNLCSTPSQKGKITVKILIV